MPARFFCIVVISVLAACNSKQEQVDVDPLGPDDPGTPGENLNPAGSGRQWRFDHSWFMQRSSNLNKNTRYKYGLVHMQRVASHLDHIAIAARFSENVTDNPRDRFNDYLPLLYRASMQSEQPWHLANTVSFSERQLSDLAPALAMSAEGRVSLFATHPFPYGRTTLANGDVIDTSDECIMVQYLPNDGQSGDIRSFWSSIFGLAPDSKLLCPFSDRNKSPNEVEPLQARLQDAWIPSQYSADTQSAKLYLLSSQALGIYRGPDYSDKSMLVGSAEDPSYYQVTTSWNWLELSADAASTGSVQASDMSVHGQEIVIAGPAKLHSYNLENEEFKSHAFDFGAGSEPRIFDAGTHYHVISGDKAYRIDRDAFWADPSATGQTYDLAGTMTDICGLSDSEVYAINDLGQVWHFDGTVWSKQLTVTYEDLNAARTSQMGALKVGSGSTSEAMFETPSEAPSGAIQLNAIDCGDAQRPAIIVGNYGTVLVGE